ncbi:hypothetical protein HPY42_06480 [Coprothermobacteraceae bacterium]|nr:hypothetical protein [Coprothermobacteraceae bacterium]
MGHVELPLLWVKSPEMQQILLTLQDALNKLSEDNFPNPLSADNILAANSLTGSLVLKDYSTPLKKLAWREWPIELVLAPQPVATTSSLDCGGFWVFDPAKYPGGTWYFEAAIRISNASYIATAQLKSGANVLASVTTRNTNYTVVRSGAVTMPTAQAVLTVTLASNNRAGTAYLWTARMIYVP